MIKLLPRLTVSFVVMTFFLSISIISCKQDSLDSEKLKTSNSATVEELGQMNRDFAKALTAKDAVAASILYDENASLLPPNEPIVIGRANIQAYWKGAIDAGIIDASVKTIDAKSDGDLGYEIGTFTLRFQGAKGDTIVEVGKYTEILKRNSEGKWISTYGMWSSNEPMPAK
jgi:ketosteroid isomerase-like protein